MQTGLEKLVAAELLYQRGRPPHARYVFKHALIQDIAYQSLLKRTRQDLHQRIVQVLETRFPATVETQPELLAYHCTEAGLTERGIDYWHTAGQMASAHSAYLEAIAHFRTGLQALKTLSDSAARARHELRFYIALGGALTASQGSAAAEVGDMYDRAWALCQQVGESQQRFDTLLGRVRFYLWRGNMPAMREIGAQYLALAEAQHDPGLILEGHMGMGIALCGLGEFVAACRRLAHSQTPWVLPAHSCRSPHEVMGTRIGCLSFYIWSMWCLGYMDQALTLCHDILTLGHELGHPFTLALALSVASRLHLLRREPQTSQEYAEAMITLSEAQGFPIWSALGKTDLGGALSEQGRRKQGISQIHQSLKTLEQLDARLLWPWHLGLLAEAYRRDGQSAAGLTVIAEAFEFVHQNENYFYESELHRIKGELLQRQTDPDVVQAEACFQQALDVARKQQAKSWELRAATSLARLCQSQDKRRDAYDLLAPVYGWFTEGFDTVDLLEAKALLDELAR